MQYTPALLELNLISRIRHVKCDEEKPACLKCRSTGRTCDGYLTNTKRRTPVETIATPSSPDFASSQILHAHHFSIVTGLTPSISGTTQERHCFEYFRFQIGQELSYVLLPESTYKYVLQACHSDDAIKSAVIAIGSMGQRLRVNHLLTSDNTQANGLQDFAQLQYCKALRHLRAQMCSDPARSVELAIISCFLFTIFEFLQGNDAGSLVHLRSGLNILRRESKTNGVTPGRDSLRREITRIFSVLDMAATMWLGLRSLQSPAIMPLEEWASFAPDPPSLNHFLDLDDAAAALNYQITRMYQCRRWVTPSDISSIINCPKAYAQCRDFMAELEQWPAALDALLDSMEQSALNVEMQNRVSVMQMNYKTVVIQTTLCLERRDEQYVGDEHEAEYRQILSLAESIIFPMDEATKSRIDGVILANNRGPNPMPLFSFFAGIIHPLFVVAVNCRNLSASQEAVSLLSTTPWREGAWDSCSMARIAGRKILELQAEGYYDEGLGSVFGLYVDRPMRSPSDGASLG